MTKAQVEAGSFRDREGRVFYHEGRVLRALSRTAAEAWRDLSGCRFFERLSAAGKIVGTREADFSAADLRELSAHWVTALEHDRLPFISYPYEWSFGMLQDAALLQLELLSAALDEGMVLKDATPYNVQWRGARPVFIDVASFEKWSAGDPWVGYLQFCQLFLYPLLLTAYRDVPFHPWLRGAIDGITPEECNRLLPLRDRLRPGVLTDVYLQAKLKDKAADSDRSMRSDLRQAGFRRELIVANVKRLEKIVRKLRWRRKSSQWASYADDNTYDRENLEIKRRFVQQTAAVRRWPLIWDLGCNTGVFSRLAAEHAETVVAIDGDPLAVERLYRSLKAEGPGNVLPLVNDLADASPPLGWRNRERKALTDRALPDLTLCLALIHHLVITANIPTAELVDWLASLDSHLIIEFITKDDPMVKKLLRNKPDIYRDYELEIFEKLLADRFEVLRTESYHSGTRKLFYARPRLHHEDH